MRNGSAARRGARQAVSRAGSGAVAVRPGEKPEAFLAITLHPIETITPTAQSWSLPVTAYTVVPGEDEDDAAKEIEINKRTQEAARDVLSQSRYDGKIVVMTWEHKHIAKSKLEKAYPGEEVTLRQLFHLNQVAGAPKTWPDANYDFFWIVDFAARNPIPSAFAWFARPSRRPSTSCRPTNGRSRNRCIWKRAA